MPSVFYLFLLLLFTDTTGLLLILSTFLFVFHFFRTANFGARCRIVSVSFSRSSMYTINLNLQHITGMTSLFSYVRICYLFLV